MSLTLNMIAICISVTFAAGPSLGLLPSDTGYYSFAGSLTIFADSIAKFGKIYPMNARPVQPLNGRDITATR
jgi:carbonic anhydrase